MACRLAVTLLEVKSTRNNSRSGHVCRRIGLKCLNSFEAKEGKCLRAVKTVYEARAEVSRMDRYSDLPLLVYIRLPRCKHAATRGQTSGLPLEVDITWRPHAYIVFSVNPLAQSPAFGASSVLGNSSEKITPKSNNTCCPQRPRLRWSAAWRKPWLTRAQISLCLGALEGSIAHSSIAATADWQPSSYMYCK